MDLDEILGHVMPHDEGYVEPVAEKKLEEMGEFKFSTQTDANGLPIESKSYVKRSCKDCYGRGYQIQSFGGRRYQTCGCVRRGYQRAAAEEVRRLDRLKAAAKKAFEAATPPEKTGAL
jgi:hypothetical protein